MRTRVLAAVAALAATLLTGAATGARAMGDDPAHGYWLTENGKAIVLFAPCGPETCGRMVWLANPVDAEGRPKLDARERPLCGLELVGGMVPSRAGVWERGWIYNPQTGRTYSAELRSVSETELKVRGFVGLSVLGSSQIWTRVEGDRGGCTS